MEGGLVKLVASEGLATSTFIELSEREKDTGGTRAESDNRPAYPFTIAMKEGGECSVLRTLLDRAFSTLTIAL